MDFWCSLATEVTFLQGSYWPIHSLLPRERIDKYCPRDNRFHETNPRANITHTSSGNLGVQTKSPPSGNISVLVGCISQYIPPFGNICINVTTFGHNNFLSRENFLWGTNLLIQRMQHEITLLIDWQRKVKRVYKMFFMGNKSCDLSFWTRECMRVHER